MNRPYAVCFIVVIMAFVFGFAGCRQDGTAEKAGEIMDDSAITAKIKAEILSDPLFKVSQINVSATNNVVMLSGVVDSQQGIDRAVEIAHGVKNVKSVVTTLSLNKGGTL